jgi:hypothetical protein
MATKKKVKAVEPEEVSSVEPEVAAVPMTMAAVTPRSNGQSTNGFAKVEQGKSYVLSVNAPSGPGEVELLAADSDQQSEPDMFSMLYEKIETARQIPFIAISPFVFVNVGSSDVQWLVTPANFSLAVPGVSSGGGESFDPASDYNISGKWKFTQPLKIAEATVATEAVTLGYVNARFQQTVDIISTQTIGGTKTFSASPVVPIPTVQNQAANKNYVDANIIQVKSLLEKTMGYVEMTEAEYNALSEKANNCIYYLTDKSMWAIGDKDLVTSDMPA